MKKLLFAITAFVLLMSACKEDEKEDLEPTLTAGETMLSGKDWRLISEFTVYTKGTNDSTHNDFADLKDCEKDDLLFFNTNKIITEKAGASKCDPSEPASTDVATWSLSADNKKLTIAVLAVTFEASIQELSATNLTIVSTEPDDDFDAIKTTSVYVKN